MGKITAEIKAIKDLEFGRYNIPIYQRPYRWQNENVETLLNCIKNNLDKSEYRIGSIIVNPKDGKLDVVDGQQRLTTLSLLFMCIDENTEYKVQCRYSHIESQRNIYKNYHSIKKWLVRNQFVEQEEKQRLQDFVLNKCSVVRIEAEDISEAFQMFDSQNGRGKELEAHDLLKAFHIRSMDMTTNRVEVKQEKIEIVRKWEDSSGLEVGEKAEEKESLLKFLVNDLYRTRRWTRSTSESVERFGKRKIKEFKGIQIRNGSSVLPLHNQSLLFCLNLNEKVKIPGAAQRTLSKENENQNPFVSINMSIVNGEPFFAYIQTYVSIYKYLFQTDFEKGDVLCDFHNHFQNACLGYKAHTRTGDYYIREVYMALVIALFDRFGEEYVKKHHKTLYALIYRKRLEQQAVYYKSVAKDSLGLFSIISNAIDDQDLSELYKLVSKPIKCSKLSENERDVAKFLLQAGCNLECEETIELNGKTFNKGEIITDKDL